MPSPATLKTALATYVLLDFWEKWSEWQDLLF
jgi:hypothetical protein